MFDERIYKIIEKNPKFEYYKYILESGFVVIEPKILEYLNDKEELVYQSNKKISKKLVLDMISHDDSYNMLKKLYKNELYAVNVTFIDEDGNYKNQYIFTRMGLIDLLKQIDIREYPGLEDRYNEFMDYVSYDKYISSVINNNYSIIIDNKRFLIPIKDIILFMGLPDLEVDKILNNKYLFGISSHYFLYAVNNFYMENKILDNYIVNDSIRERLKYIMSSSRVDVQMINKYNETDDSMLSNIKVDLGLENEILRNLPYNFSDLEKAIYIYIKMCKLLTYDDEYYAINQKGVFAEKHKVISNVSNISLSNNKVVCYEFNAIYSYMLNKIGVNYKKFVNVSNDDGTIDEELFDDDFYEYSEGHSFLKFRCDKYLVKADSVTSILQGDIMQAKLNQPLRGLVCENINKESRLEFAKTMKRVYSYIAEREPRISQNDVESYESFDDIVNEFNHVTDKLKSVDIEDKIDILISKVNSTKMVGIDAYSYLLQLRKILFNKVEQRNNIKISIIRNSNDSGAEALAIISIRLPDESGKMIINRYIFKPGSKLIPITKDDLQTNFNNNSMGYVDLDDPIIPGIRR